MTTRIFCVLEEAVLALLILVLTLEEQKDTSEFVDEIDASDKRLMLLSLFEVLLRSDSMSVPYLALTRLVISLKYNCTVL